MRARALPLAAALGLGCFVQPADYAGRECDSTRACFDGRECVAGRCVLPGSDGGTGPSCVTWRQAGAGFAKISSCAGCSVTVEGSRGNRLTATIPRAGAGADFALGVVEARDLPRAAEGQLRGRFFAPASVRVDDKSSIVRLLATGGVLIDFFLDANWEAGTFTGAGVLQPGAVDEVNRAERFPPGAEHLVEIAWRQGAFRTVRVDGKLLFQQSLSPFDGGAALPQELHLGIDGYAGNSSQGWSVSLDGWQLCDDAQERLSD